MRASVLQDWLLLAGYSTLGIGTQKREKKHCGNYQTEDKWWEHDSQGIGTCKHLKGYHEQMKGMVLYRKCVGLRRCYGQAGCKQYEKREEIK